MPPLEDAVRARLLRLSAFLCTTAVLLAPLAGRSSVDAPRVRVFWPTARAAQSTDSTRTAIVVRRDPFVAPPGAEGVSTTPSALTLPPNRGAAEAPFTVPPSADDGEAGVRAIVTGDSPAALVDDGAETHVVRIGQAAFGSRVVAIAEREIRLADGRILRIDEERE